MLAKQSQKWLTNMSQSFETNYRLKLAQYQQRVQDKIDKLKSEIKPLEKQQEQLREAKKNLEKFIDQPGIEEAIGYVDKELIMLSGKLRERH